MRVGKFCAVRLLAMRGGGRVRVGNFIRNCQTRSNVLGGETCFSASPRFKFLTIGHFDFLKFGSSFGCDGFFQFIG